MRIFFFTILFTTLAANAMAAPKETFPWLQEKKEAPALPPGQASAESRASVVNRVERYLNRLTTMVASFVQEAPDGSVSEGKFYLSRPGKLRWEYYPPVRVTIVANSGLVTYYDAELDQISHTSINSTPLVFLTDKQVSLSKGKAMLKDVAYNRSAIQLTLTQQSKEEEGSIVLTFTDNPLELRQMALIDPVGNRTTVTFTNATYAQSIDKRLFILENPRLFKKRKH